MLPIPPPTPAPLPQPAHRTLVWLHPDQAPVIRAVGDAAGLRFVAAGTSLRGRSAEVALSLATTPLDDLRAALAGAMSDPEAGIDLVLLADPHDFGADLSSSAEADRDAIRACRERGITVATLEPLPSSVMAFARPTAGSPEMSDPDTAPTADPSQPIFVPRFRASRPFRDLTESLEGFGAPRAVQVESLCRSGQCSLGARLYDAVDAIRSMLGDPESVHAAYTPAPGTERASVRDLSADSLRDVHGTLSLNLQFPDGRIGHVLASDAAARWSRTVTLLGDSSSPESGLLRAGDDVFQWIGVDGTILDGGSVRTGRKKPPKTPRPSAKAADSPHALLSNVIAAHLRECLTGRAPTEPPVDGPRVLAVAGAALLSARTGQAESVGTVLRMMGLGAA